jgi:Flp pilus assembly protein TadD
MLKSESQDRAKIIISKFWPGFCQGLVFALSCALVLTAFPPQGSLAKSRSTKSSQPTSKGKRLIASSRSSRSKKSKKRVTVQKKSRATLVDEPPPVPYEKATEALSRAYVLRDMAEAEQLRGDFGDAARHFAEACEITRNFPGPANLASGHLEFNLAKASEAAGKSELARKSYLEALRQSPKSLPVHLSLANLCAKTGKLSEAVVYARKAIDCSPSDPRPHLLLGLLLERQGKFVEGKAEQDKAWKLLGSYPIAAKVKPDLPDNNQDALADEEKSEESDADMPLGLP